VLAFLLALLLLVPPGAVPKAAAAEQPPSPHQAEQPPSPRQADTPPAAAPLSVSSAKIDALMTALKAGDFAGASALFNDKMKVAVPETKLRAVWRDIVASVGNLVSWSFEPPKDVQGMEQRLGSLRFEHGEAKAIIVVDPRTGLVAGFVVRPAAAPAAEHAAYVDTTLFRAVELQVGSEPYLLGATLTIPLGNGPFPAVVLVHGSGPQDRDETIGANRVFRDIAEGLSSKGIAVLRYDKRTLTYRTQMAGQNITINDEVVLDAVAAVRQLASWHEIDPKRIFVLGHSLGAQLAPEIGVRAGNIAGVVLLAPPGRPPWDVVLAQMRYLGTPEDQIADAERKVALLRQGKLGKETLLGVGASYWMDWASRDGIAVSKKLGKPMLVLRGDRDFQVAEEDLDAWRRGLAGMPNVTVASVPGVNHLFIRGDGKPSPAEYDVPGHVDPELIEGLQAFITAGAAKKR
jgi:dienelactone hydrolase